MAPLMRSDSPASYARSMNIKLLNPCLVMLLVGLTLVIVPTIATLARWSWSTDTGAHGPIVLATALWLIWHDRRLLKTADPNGSSWGLLVIAIAVPSYFFGRVTHIVALEGAACLAICIGTAATLLGWRLLTKFWFHIAYLTFILAPPENWIFVATRPIKTLIANSAVFIMSKLGFNISGSASMVLVDGYQMQVAAACSGVNSLLGITALGLFYVYLRHGNQPKYALALCTMLVPVAILTNFLRVVGLILAIHWAGDGLLFNLVHDIGGVAMFAIALGMLFALDEILSAVRQRRGILQ